MEQGKPKQKRAFIYCRTSVDSETDDGEKVSIETQEESGRELAKRHGYKVIHVFKDRNRSGRLYPTGFEIPDKAVDAYCNSSTYSATNRTRKEFGEMMTRIREVDVIIVRNADRLMRPLELSKLDAHILSILLELNIVIHSHDDNIIDPHNPDHILIFKLKSTIQSRYISDRRDETKIGMKKRRDEGQLYFPPRFYGFRTDGHQKVKRMPDEIKVVQMIFTEFLKDKATLKGIARDLNSSQVPTLTQKGKSKEGKGFWLDCTIRAILKRPQYAGFQYKSNGTEKVDVPVFLPPVISAEIFKQVQDKLEEKKQNTGGNTKMIHGLTGLLHCGFCGYKLYTTATYMISGGKKYKLESFRCISYTKTQAACPCKGVQIRERFPKGLKRKNGFDYSNGLEDCLFPLIYKGYINHLIAKNRRVGLDNEIEDCLAKLERNQNYKKNLGKKLMENVIDDKTFNALIKECIEASSTVEQKLAILQKEANDIDRIVVPTKLYSDYASHKIPDELKRRLFRSIIDHIDVWHTHIVVYFKEGGSFTLKRVRMGKTYILPSWEIAETNKGSFKATKTDGGVRIIQHKHTAINENTKIDVVYEYDNDEPMKIIYGDNNIIIMTQGKKRQKTSA